AHRVGLIFEHVAGQLLSAEIPAKVVEPGAVRVFCGALRDGAAPFLERAREAYAYCARRALEFGVSNDATRACDAALTRLDRKAWPPLLEFVGEPQPWGELQPRS